jgi:Nif-specific regulatory protein
MGSAGAREWAASPGSPSYLVIRRGSARRSIVPLTPGEILTIGRAQSNRVVIPDPKCSRQHCEIFFAGGQWTVRDLASRNGVLVDGIRIDREQSFSPGQVLTVGSCDIEFTDRPPEDAVDIPRTIEATESEVFDLDIIERKSGTRYDRMVRRDTGTRTKPGLDELYQMARAMADATTSGALAERTLEGLFHTMRASIGAVLLLPEPTADPDPAQLACVAYRSKGGDHKPEVSSYLSRAVLEDREALLARDVSENASLSKYDSLGRLRVQSAICTPLRRSGQILGLIHLYALEQDEAFDADDLEFTLAVGDQLAVALHTVRERESLEDGLSRAEEEAFALRQQLEVDTELVGDSPQMHALRMTIGRVAPTDAAVLVRGESGVGKELVARAVHFNSRRREGPFVCLNCAALTESLLESELFGHEKGSFTGASGRKIGKFEQAHRGTLFLDEVGEMSPEIQAKFLRVLEGHPFERVGGSQPITIDVRVVTATNRNLERAVREGQFRQDLFFRLQVLEISVPPLRAHPEDIRPLACHFLERITARSRIIPRSFSDEALDVLKSYHWPGNVRELKNVIERSAILSDHVIMTAEDIRLLNLDRLTPLAENRALAPAIGTTGPATSSASPLPSRPASAVAAPQTVGSPGPSGSDLQWSFLLNEEVSLDELESRFIAATLERHDWNKSRAAKQLGIERTTLDRKLKKYGIERGDQGRSDSETPDA